MQHLDLASQVKTSTGRRDLPRMSKNKKKNGNQPPFEGNQSPFIDPLSIPYKIILQPITMPTIKHTENKIKYGMLPPFS